jgi:hypothetical protein
MPSSKKAYFVLRYTTYPKNGPIKLGSIVQDPLAPEDSINHNAILPIPESLLVHTVPKTDHKQILKTPANLTVGVFAKFLQMTGLNVSFDKTIVREDEWQFEKLERDMFKPTKEYVESALAAPALAAFVASQDVSPNLYIVTGINIATGTTHKWKRNKTNNTNANAGINVDAGVGVTVGPKITYSKGDADEGEATIKDEFVFAYRVQEIEYKKNVVRLKDVFKGELHGKGDAKVLEEAKKEKIESLGLRRLVESDAGGDDVDRKGEEGYDELDEEGEKCEIIVLPEVL